MAAQHHPTPSPQGIGNFLWGVIGSVLLGGMLGGWITLSTRGAEFLGMPAWTYSFTAFACVGSAGLLWAADALATRARPST
jgi:hypothetical protein